jgi:hypothetical protein
VQRRARIVAPTGDSSFSACHVSWCRQSLAAASRTAACAPAVVAAAPSAPKRRLANEPSAASLPDQCLEEEPLVATTTVPSSAVVMPILRANLMNTSSSVALATPQSSTCAFEPPPKQLVAEG